MNQSESIKALILDDSYMDSLVLKHMLVSLNVVSEIEVFGDPLNLLNHFIEKKWKNLPGIIFLDLNLPGMNGFQFLDALNKLSSKKCSEIKVVMITSSDDPEDIRRSSDYPSIQKYIVKPVNRIDLEDLFEDRDLSQMTG